MAAKFRELRGGLGIKAVIGIVGDQQAPRRCQGFKPCRNIDAVTEQIVVFENHFTGMDAHPQLDDLMAGQFRLHIYRTVYGIGDAGEFDDPTVAHILDNSAIVAADRGFEELLTQFTQGIKRADLILAHKARIADDIGGKDRGKTALQS